MKTWDKESPRFIRINGFRIAYHRQGVGEPLLFVHGITTYSFIWRKLIPALSREFDVIAIDLLGCGDSDKPLGVDYSIQAQSGIIRELIQELDAGPVHLVTHDIGGGIGQILAVTTPEICVDLTLINPVGYDYWPVQPILTMRIPVIRQIAMAMLDTGLFRSIVRHGTYHKDRVTGELMELFRRPLRSPEGRRGFLHLARCLNNGQLMAIAEQLTLLKMPVLIIRGDADPYLSPAISERLRREIPGARLERMVTGGHFIQVDEPERLVSLITNFIRERQNV